MLTIPKMQILTICSIFHSQLLNISNAHVRVLKFDYQPKLRPWLFCFCYSLCPNWQLRRIHLLLGLNLGQFKAPKPIFQHVDFFAWRRKCPSKTETTVVTIALQHELEKEDQRTLVQSSLSLSLSLSLCMHAFEGRCGFSGTRNDPICIYGRSCFSRLPKEEEVTYSVSIMHITYGSTVFDSPLNPPYTWVGRWEYVATTTLHEEENAVDVTLR